MRKRKKKPGRQRKKPSFQARYGVGSHVRVKPGTTDPDFEDIPLGGWGGEISEVDQRSNPPTYLIEWDQHTLDHMHPVFRKRCERDGLEMESMWLGEDDLEPDSGGLAVIEQPTSIVTRPLSKDDQDDRIRAIFGLTSDDPLPAANAENLRKYHRHLATHLAFPFPANYTAESSPFYAEPGPVTIIGLLDPDKCQVEKGLLVETAAAEKGNPVELPLIDIESTINLHNRQLIEDYTYWFVNAPDQFTYASEPPQVTLLPASPSFSSAPVAARDVVHTILACGVFGALYGAVLGSLVTATESARTAASVGAVIVAFLTGVVGTKFGTIFGAVNQIWYGPLLMGTLGAIAGGALGALLGAMAVAFVGSVGGGIVGGLIGSHLANLRWQPLTSSAWVLFGSGAGAVAQAVSWSQEKALNGAMIGAGAGAILGSLLYLAIVGSLAWIARDRGR